MKKRTDGTLLIIRLIWVLWFVAGFLPARDGRAQLRQIDTAKLPQDQSVQSAYSALLPAEYMARGWSNSWPYDTPKQEVVSLFTSSLHDLSSAAAAAPENEELFLLTGLVARLAFNLDVEEAYDTAVQSLEKAHQLAPTDYRAPWFLGIHKCQSNDIKGGMIQLLAVEDRVDWQQLPIDFWHDYVNCSTLSNLPAHMLRAVDHAVHLGESPSSYDATVDIANKRYKATDAATTYASSDAWRSFEENGEFVFASDLCGTAFTAHRDWQLKIGDVTDGICTSQIQTGPYSAKNGESTPTLLLLTRLPKPQETLDDFAQSILKGRFASATRTLAPVCPADKCLAFEIIAKKMYPSEGGGHFLVVAFAAQPPDYPGLLFERPGGPPKSNSDGKVAIFRPNQKLRRLPGTLYSLVLLDSNGSIFEKAKEDFAYLVKSIRLD